MQITAAFVSQASRGRNGICLVSLLLTVCLCAATAQTQPGKQAIEVPFEFVHNQIVVQVKIAGKGPLNMLIDTNTDPSAIDSTTAQVLGLSVGSKGGIATGGGTEVNAIHPTRLPTVELGEVIAKDVVAATIDLTKISKRIERPIHGVLGFSFLKDRIIQIDYPKMKLRFFNVSPYPRIELAPNTVNIIALPFRREDGEVMIDSVFINNEKLRATLDTGSSGTFSLTPEAVALLGLDEQAQDGKSQTSVGYNGEFESKSAVLNSVRLGRYAAESVPATLWPPNTGHDKKRFQVNIGNGFFQDFVVTFDFPKKIVVLERVE